MAGAWHRPWLVPSANPVENTVFAFEPGTELREHTADEPALLQPLEGELTVRLAGQTVTLRMGDLLHIEPNVPHSVTAAGPAKLQLTILMIDSPGPSRIPLEAIE